MAEQYSDFWSKPFEYSCSYYLRACPEEASCLTSCCLDDSFAFAGAVAGSASALNMGCSFPVDHLAGTMSQVAEHFDTDYRHRALVVHQYLVKDRQRRAVAFHCCSLQEDHRGSLATALAFLEHLGARTFLAHCEGIHRGWKYQFAFVEALILDYRVLLVFPDSM